MTATTMTLLELRRLVAVRLGDYHGDASGDYAPGTLTTGGTTNSIDTARIEGVDYFKGGYFTTTAPTAIQLARISAWDSTLKKFTFSKTLSALSAGDKYEVFRLFSPGEYRAAINEAIRRVATVCRTEVASDESLTLSYNQTEYTVPSTFDTLYRVSVENAWVTDDWYELSPTDWDTRVGDGTVVLHPSVVGVFYGASGIAQTRRLKLEGTAKIVPNLALETDTTVAPGDFVVPAAVAWLCRTVAQGRRDFQGREELLKQVLAEAQAAYTVMRPTVRHRNEKRVRQP